MTVTQEYSNISYTAFNIWGGGEQHSIAVKTKQTVHKSFWHAAILYRCFNQQEWNGDKISGKTYMNLRANKYGH
jgi:hypothetical protein